MTILTTRNVITIIHVKLSTPTLNSKQHSNITIFEIIEVDTVKFPRIIKRLSELFGQPFYKKEVMKRNWFGYIMSAWHPIKL